MHQKYAYRKPPHFHALARELYIIYIINEQQLFLFINLIINQTTKHL